MNNETEGQRLRKVIKKLGLKQNSFAESLGIDDSQISRIIKQGNQPAKYMYVLMTAVHNINIDYLKTGKGPMFLTSSSAKERIKRELLTMSEEQALSVLTFIQMLKKNKKED